MKIRDTGHFSPDEVIFVFSEDDANELMIVLEQNNVETWPLDDLKDFVRAIAPAYTDYDTEWDMHQWFPDTGVHGWPHERDNPGLEIRVPYSNLVLRYSQTVWTYVLLQPDDPA